MNPLKNWLEQRRSKPETPPQEANKAAPQANKAAPQAPGNALRGGSYSVALTAVVLGYPDESPEAKPRDESKVRFID